MSLLVSPPRTIHVTTAGLTELLPALSNGTWQIYALQLVSAKKTRTLSLFEGPDKRWQGEVQQDTNIRIDFGSTGWRLKPNTPLMINSSGSLTLDVNILQYGILL